MGHPRGGHMAVSAREAVGKTAYAVLFCVLLPSLLILWAASTRQLVDLPAYGNPLLGWLLIAGGAVMMGLAMYLLWSRGGGLPMNAFPPRRYVTEGIYRFLPHPIYAGFTLVVFGAAMASGSPSGLWLVSPAVGMGCAALVLGYELHDVRRRFENTSDSMSRWMPPATLERPRKIDHSRYVFFVLVPWLAVYEIVIAIGVPRKTFILALPFEYRMPILSWTEAFYASIYIAVPLCSWFARTQRDLRLLTIRAWVAMACTFPVYLAVPVLAIRKPFVPASPLGYLLAGERAIDLPTAAFPSFHVIWAVLVADLLTHTNRRRRWLWRAWAASVAISCVTTGMHTIADVLAGSACGVMLIHMPRVWEAIRGGTERVANSWREWHFGPVRVINHGFYAGAAAFAAVAIVSQLIGAQYEPMLVFSAFCAILGAGLWAQWVEGSSRLLRPFGYYGGLFGVVLAAVAAPFFRMDPWLLLAAYAVASPWMQSIGRLRCLVQGCCHGRPAREEIGILYRHPSSRVCRIAEWNGVPLHPTPLYSILWNMFIAMVLVRLWAIGAPLHSVGGVFLILSGLGRFVEEGYRGEPQTAIIAGLRLYQWIAIALTVTGALITAVSQSAAAPAPLLNWSGMLWALFFAVLSFFALGVDWPESNRRFARLA
ncbi:MAG TPA: prolipoprotein diacylglyceryl transferase family protein [Bryobacteraceae bacterium]|nr:prolipoprotein diacylglyceryl transferase family protein [Bryobacteraceae bacterium]